MKKMMLFVLVVLFTSMHLSAQTNAADSSKNWFSISDSTMFKGKYKMEGVGFDFMELTVKDSSLFYSGGEYAGILAPIKGKKDTFDAMGQAVFSFSRNSMGEIELLSIDYSGATYLGKKEKPGNGTK